MAQPAIPAIGQSADPVPGVGNGTTARTGAAAASEPRSADRGRRTFRARFVVGYLLSYAIDSVLLGLFALAGTIASWIPIAYLGCGLAVGALFGSLMLWGNTERYRDPYFTGWQVLASAAIMLVFLAFAPAVGFLFLCTLFLVFGFGGLRMAGREAVLFFVLIAAGTGSVLYYTTDFMPVPHSTPLERLLVWMTFLLILARLIVLGLVGSALRVRVVDGYRRLKAAAADLEARTKELVESRAATEAATRGRWDAERRLAQEKLRLTEERYRALAETAGDYIFAIDRSGKIEYVNEFAASRFGCRPEEIAGRQMEALFPPEVGRRQRANLQRVFETRTAYYAENKSVLPQGELWLGTWLTPQFDEDGEVQAVLGISRDISELKNAEASLRAQTERLRIGQSAARLLVLEWEVVPDELSWSDSPEWLRGPLPADGKYPPFKDQVHPEDVEDFLSSRALTLAGKDQTHEFRIVRTDGRQLWVRSQQRVSAWVDGKAARVLIALLDISEYKRAQEEIRFLAFQDHLTGLPNRALLKDRMAQAIAHAVRAGGRVALIFIDLDNFKTVNDSLGHSAGDALLKQFAGTLLETVRPTDTVSRQGGDEFIILLTNLLQPEAVTPVLEKLFRRFDLPFHAGGEELVVSASVGVAHYPDDGSDFDTLLKKADTAMYRAKEAGKNTYRFYDEQMNTDAIDRMRIRGGLRSALERGEFVLHYQPQIDLASGALRGAEALIRWNSPGRGLALPGRFISIAEDSGLIVPIGEWVLCEACRQAAAWRRAGVPNLVVAVNLSAVQFRRGALDKTVTAALDESGLPPELLELELTESILIQGTEATLATVRRLKGLGLKLSIDDFGTGYSSLSYLKRFAVDKLKIDQSFIRHLRTDPEDAAIFRAIIQMAKSLELRTIAEGVEDVGLADYLRRYHCDEAQGYYFARPMPAEEFADYLSRSAAATNRPDVLGLEQST